MNIPRWKSNAVVPLAALVAVLQGCAGVPDGAVAIERQGSFFVGGRDVDEVARLVQQWMVEKKLVDG